MKNFNLLHGETLEPLSPCISVIVSREYRFNTDTILLADFAKPRPGEICADLGTGCGAIPLLWCARTRPRKIYAVELQETAVEMARRSTAGNELGEILEVWSGDLRSFQAPGPRGLDLIACNPPYKPGGTGVRCPEEARSIARHEVACTFEEITKTAARLLRFGGRFCFCLRPERLCAAMCALREAGLEPKRLRLVQQRVSKAPFLFLMEAARGGKPGLLALPTLFIEATHGGWSPDMLEIYGDYKSAGQTLYTP